MNKKAIFEIGNIIHIRNTFNKKTLFRRLTPKEITKTEEYKRFKFFNPEICRLAEGDKN